MQNNAGHNVTVGALTNLISSCSVALEDRNLIFITGGKINGM